MLKRAVVAEQSIIINNLTHLKPIMSLPNLFSRNKKPKNELFITLLLTEKTVSSALWKVIEQEVQLLNQSQTRQYQTEDEQLLQCDESLQDLGKESEATDQVLFALEPEWATQSEVKVPHDARLQELCKALSLQAAGFVLTTEALINHLLHNNRFLSALVLYIGANMLTLTVIHQGKQSKTLSVGRSDNILLDVQEVLARLNGDLTEAGRKLPLNIIMAGASLEADELRQYQQQLLSINWIEEHEFIQQPVIDLVLADELMEAVVREGGLALAQEQGLAVAPQQDAESAPGGEVGSTSAITLESSPLSANITSPPVAVSSPKPPQTQAASFGVPLDPSQLSSSLTNQDKKNQDRLLTNQNLASPAFSPTKIKKKKLIAIAVVGAFLGLVVAAAISFFLLRARYQVELVIQPKTQDLSRELVVTLNPGSTRSDPEQQLLQAEQVLQETSGSESMLTTGVKQVGEKAEGEVRILNKTDADKTFEEGTRLRVDSLEFVTAERITVPASEIEVSSTGDSENRKYGQKTVKVRATEIGTDSNLLKDTDFKVESYSDDTYSARAVENFSGGSSREIRVVSDQDIKELLVTLRQRLLKEARDKLLEQQRVDRHIVPTEEFKILSQKYTGEIGDEADNISLSLSLQVEGLSYTNQDLIELAKVVLADEVPEGFEFIEKGLKVESKLIDGRREGLGQQIEANIRGKAQAKLKSEQYLELILGNSIQEAKNKLSQEEFIEKAELEILPRIATNFFSTVPSQAERVVIRIQD